MTPERLQKINQVLARRQGDLTVLLENVEDPHNISAVLRSCDAVGIQDVFVLHTKAPRYQKLGHKSSSSAHKWVSVHQFTDMYLCVDTLKKRYHNLLCAYLDKQAPELYTLDLTTSVALVFGNETSGVSNALRELCQGDFIIPQVGMIQSLNISVACAVSVYEAFRQKTQKGHYETPKLPPSQAQELRTLWLSSRE